MLAVGPAGDDRHLVVVLKLVLLRWTWHFVFTLVIFAWHERVGGTPFTLGMVWVVCASNTVLLEQWLFLDGRPSRVYLVYCLVWFFFKNRILLLCDIRFILIFLIILLIHCLRLLVLLSLRVLARRCQCANWASTLVPHQLLFKLGGSVVDLAQLLHFNSASNIDIV